jgi:hypothetical protein
VTTDAITRCGDAVAVFEGPRRIQWSRRGPAEWIPLSVWPDEDELRDMRRHLSQQRRLLVILDEPLTVVPLLAEELAAAGDAVITLVEDREGEPVYVRIQALDWLPCELRQRGLRFLEASTQHAATIPIPLRPALVLEDPKVGDSHVRFAHRLRSSMTLDHHMSAIIDKAFATSGQAATG